MPGYPASVRHNQAKLHLGTFATEQEATAAELIALAELRGTTPDLPDTIPTDVATRLSEQIRNRLATLTQSRGRQLAKLRSDNTRGLRGVFSTSKPWKAEIAANRRRFALGTYRTRGEAATAYNVAALVIHGPDAVLNEIPADELPTPERVEQIRRDVTNRLGTLAQPALAN